MHIFVSVKLNVTSRMVPRAWLRLELHVTMDLKAKIEAPLQQNCASDPRAHY